MPTIDYKNLNGIAQPNVDQLHQWDAGTAVPVVQPGTPGEGDMWFDEVTNILYTYTGGSWDDGVILATETYEPSLGDMWFDEGADLLYQAELINPLPISLDPPTVTEGYVFAGWSTDPSGSNLITEITSEAQQAIYAQWLRIGDHVALDIFEPTDFSYKVNRNFIVEVKPIKALVNGTQKYRIQIVVSPGNRLYLKTTFATRAEAFVARDELLAILI